MLSNVTEIFPLKIKFSIAAHLWLRLYILSHRLPWNSGICNQKSTSKIWNQLEGWFYVSKMKTLISFTDRTRPCQTIWCFFGRHRHNFQVKKLFCHKSPKVALRCHKLHKLSWISTKLPYFYMHENDIFPIKSGKLWVLSSLLYSSPNPSQSTTFTGDVVITIKVR